MRPSIPQILGLCKQVIASLLSVILLINTAVPALAQSVPDKYKSRVAQFEKQFEEEYKKQLQQTTFASESTQADTGFKKFGEMLDKQYYSDPVILKLLEFHRAFFSPAFLPETAEKDEYDEFLKEYSTAIQQQASAALEQLKAMQRAQQQYMEQEIEKAHAASVSDLVIKTWQEQEEQKLQQMLATGQANIRAWQQQQMEQAPQQYEMARQLAEEQSHQILSVKLRELMDLYYKYPQKASAFVVDISMAVLMTTGSQTDLFTKQDKEALRKLYARVVSNGHKCAQEKGACTRVLSAVSGLGILGGGLEDGAVISDFIKSQWQTPQASAVLIAGMSALLAMQNYGAVRGLLHEATQQEFDTSASILSVASLATAFANRNGQYLGAISKWASFPLPSKEGVQALTPQITGNAWEEVAYMLAEDGSKQALSILNDFSINLCVARQKMSVEDPYGVACTAIQPFLVGAVLSGKTGAYTSPVNENLQEGTVLENNRSRYISGQEAAKNRQTRQKMQQDMQAYAASFDHNVAAAIAWSLYLNDMGDLDADHQLALDKKLFAFFHKATKGQTTIDASLRLTPYEKNSEEYKAKERRYHRSNVLFIMGTVIDIGFLIWCAVDIIRFSVKAVNLGRAVYLTTKMARAGVGASARVSVLWKLKAARTLTKINRRLPARIKNGLSVSIQNIMPQFTTVEPLLKVPGGVKPSFTQAALQGAKFSLQTGEFALQSKNLASTLQQPSAVPQINTLKNTLNLAAKRANVQFASSHSLWDKLPGQSNARYRRYLSAEIRSLGKQIYNARESGYWMDLAAQVRADKTIRVPQAVKELKEMVLIDAQGKVNQVAIQRVIGPILKTLTARQQLEIKNALNAAQEQAGLAYANRKRWKRFTNALFRQNQTLYNDLLANQLMSLSEQKNIMPSFSALQKEQVLSMLASTISNNRNISIPADVWKYAGREYNKPHIDYKDMTSALFRPEQTASPLLPIRFKVDMGVKGVRAGTYQRVIITPKNSSYVMGMSDGIHKPVDLSQFKMVIPTSNMPTLLRGASTAGLTKPLELKLTPYLSRSAFNRAVQANGEVAPAGAKIYRNLFGNLAASFRTQGKIYSHELPVYAAQAGGKEVLMPVRVMADTRLKLEGSRFVLGADNRLRLYRGNKEISSKLFYFSLPKRELGTYIKVASQEGLPQALRLTIKTGKNKLLPLFIATGVSLSSASVGLIVPLETTYKNRITDLDKTLISLALPYLPSLMSPLLGPVVMRFGALRVVQAALLAVVGGLAFTWGMGFNGHLNQDNLPPIWPLFVSGVAIGISSALSRAGLNILIDTIGGGKNLLQSMMFKNIGSVAMLAPTWLYAGMKLNLFPALRGKKLTPQQQNESVSDFSLAFPTLTAITGGVLLLLSQARISPFIGRSADVLKGKKMNLGKEMLLSLKTVVAPEVWPFTVGAFCFTGFEAAAFSKASSQAFRPFYESRPGLQKVAGGNRGNTVSLATGISVALLPFLARYFAPKLLKSFSNPKQKGVEYKKMLVLSYALNALGGGMLMKYGMSDQPSTADMLLGITLMGLGTANITQSLQKLANIKVGSGPTIRRMVKGFKGNEVAQKATELKNLTMTGFSWSQLGAVVVPMLQSAYIDKEVSQGISDGKGPMSSIWLPMGFLGASILMMGQGVSDVFTIKNILRSWGAGKLAVDGLSGFNPLTSGADLYKQGQEMLYHKFPVQTPQQQAAPQEETPQQAAPAEAPPQPEPAQQARHAEPAAK